MTDETTKSGLRILDGGADAGTEQKGSSASPAETFLSSFLDQLPKEGNRLPFLQDLRKKIELYPGWEQAVPRLDALIEEEKGKKGRTGKPSEADIDAFSKRCFKSLDETDKLMARGDMEGAGRLLYQLLQEFEMREFYKDKKGVDLCSATAPFEFPLFIARHFALQPNADFEFISIPVSMLYCRLAMTLWARDDEELATKLFDMSLSWNPVAVPTYFFYASMQKSYGHDEEMLKLTKAAHQCALLPEMLAQCFVNYGEYYQHRQKPLYALAMFRMAGNCQEKGGRKDPALAKQIRECEAALGKVIPENESKDAAWEICRRLGVSPGISGFAASVVCSSVLEGIKGNSELPLRTFGPLLETMEYQGDDAELTGRIEDVRRRYRLYRESRRQ